MAFKPNYNQQRSERNRVKEAKKQEKLQRREEEVARRKAARDENPDAPAAMPDDGDTVAPQYDWRPQSTYIRRPPYWDTEGVGALAASPRTLQGMRPLALLPDNITTDHLSPSNAILAGSAAGEYLARMGLPEEDFNSYATHRGDHLTDRNLARGQTEAIAATGATYAAHQTMFAQTSKQLFQIGQGDALAL